MAFKNLPQMVKKYLPGFIYQAEVTWRHDGVIDCGTGVRERYRGG